jgi:hypothetical protein
MGEIRNAYRHFVGKPEGKRPLGRPRHRWEKILEWILKRVGRCGMNASGLGLWPVACSCEHGN